MSETKKHKVWEGNITCIECHAKNSVKVEKEIVVPAEPAETRVIVTVEKPAQATLD